ncbi:vWA domain-containing protein [Stutzerimonas stutzeri]|nr:VWA domain-containing protein [Stutzerimonas stutzeri]MCQ4253456.1 VWA domain-containing protein [Stutzerimonas stutzeri]MDH2247883.1 VWA domain-containing protein [Pseudomonas sp. GD03856]MDH2266715.1 VWA domain-containing protein [Pseudomonas sp. GD03855]
MRPRSASGADARAAPGSVNGGRHGASRGGVSGRIDWAATFMLNGRPQHRNELVLRPRSRQASEVWLIIVDASGSTRRHGALSKAKGLLGEVFEQARRQRVRLALLQANGKHADWVLPGHKVTAAQQQWLTDLGAGGGTPLMDALQQAAAWQLRRQRLKPAEQHRLLVLTDGRLRESTALEPSLCPVVLVDIESAPIRLGRARKLAEELGAEYQHIDTLATLNNPV